MPPKAGIRRENVGFQTGYVCFAPASGLKWLWCGRSASDPKRSFDAADLRHFPCYLNGDKGGRGPRAMRNPFRYVNSSPEVNCLAVMMYIRYSLSLRH